MRGVTLAEIVVVLLIIGVLASVVTPPLLHSLDRLAVDEAAERYITTHEDARMEAMARGRLTRVDLDSARRQAVVLLRRSIAAWDTLAISPLGRARMTASQTSIVFSPIGMGFGASNARIVFSSDAAAETVTVSRTGRVRRS